MSFPVPVKLSTDFTNLSDEDLDKAWEAFGFVSDSEDDDCNISLAEVIGLKSYTKKKESLEPCTSTSPLRSATSSTEKTPSAIDTTSHNHYVKVDRSKLTAFYVGRGNHSLDIGCVRSNFPVPCCKSLYYYEVEIIDSGINNSIVVGFTNHDFPLIKYPGTEVGSYGYRSEDGKKSGDISGDETYGPSYTTGDIVGCGINFCKQTIFFTKNGNHLGTAFSNIPGILTLYPTVGLHSPNERICFNFGEKPFRYDIENLRRIQHRTVCREILETKVPSGAAEELVRDYLIHHGYARTLSLFDNPLGKTDRSNSTGGNGVAKADEKTQSNGYCEETSSSSGYPSSSSGDQKEKEETNKKINRSNDDDDGRLASLSIRSELRKLMLTGNTDDIMKTIQRHFPGLLERRFDLQVEITIMKFIELINAKTSLEKLIEFAQGELAPLKDNTNISQKQREKILSLPALLVYPDPKTSPMKYLLSTEERCKSADLVNEIILDHLNVKSKSALERLFQHLAVTQAALRESLDSKGPKFDLTRALRVPKKDNDI
eukprot:g2539.t1